MEDFSMCERFTSRDGALVLMMRITVAGGLCVRAGKLYKAVADAFAERVRTRLYERALDDYAACTDRRRRYRFPAHTAELSVTVDGDAAVLTIRENGALLVCERHIWDRDGIKKRIPKSKNPA